MTQEKIDEQTRLYLEAFLPDALSNALESYQKFAAEEKKHETAKDFLEHHNACKVAISHVELLLKLTKRIEGSMQQNQDLEKMIEQAKRNILEHEKSEKRVQN